MGALVESIAAQSDVVVTANDARSDALADTIWAARPSSATCRSRRRRECVRTAVVAPGDPRARSGRHRWRGHDTDDLGPTLCSTCRGVGFAKSTSPTTRPVRSFYARTARTSCRHGSAAAGPSSTAAWRRPTKASGEAEWLDVGADLFPRTAGRGESAAHRSSIAPVDVPHDRAGFRAANRRRRDRLRHHARPGRPRRAATTVGWRSVTCLGGPRRGCVGEPALPRRAAYAEVRDENQYADVWLLVRRAVILGETGQIDAEHAAADQRAPAISVRMCPSDSHRSRRRSWIRDAHTSMRAGER